MELFAPRDLGAGGSPDIVSTENIRAKTARTGFTLESRPLCVAREGNAAAGSVRTSSGGVSGRRYAKAG